MKFELCLSQIFDIEAIYEKYKVFLKTGDANDLLSSLSTPVAKLCHTYVTCYEGDFDDFCNNALIKVNNILTDIYKTKNFSFLPNSKEFRNFFYKCIRNSFSDTLRELKYGKYVEIPIFGQERECRRANAPGFMLDYETFVLEIKEKLINFVLEHDRYCTDKYTVEYIVKKFLSFEDPSVETLNKVFHTFNPYFVKGYIIVLAKIYLDSVKGDYDCFEISYYVDRKLEEDPYDE